MDVATAGLARSVRRSTPRLISSSAKEIIYGKQRTDNLIDRSVPGKKKIFSVAKRLLADSTVSRISRRRVSKQTDRLAKRLTKDGVSRRGNRGKRRQQIEFYRWISLIEYTHVPYKHEREQINCVEITESRGNARRWRVRTRNTHRRNIVAFINGPIFEDGIFAMPVSLLVSVAHRGAKLSARSRHRNERLFLRYDESQTFPSQVPTVFYGDI